MRRQALLFLFIGTWWISVSAWSATPDFEQDIVPILTGRCLACHNAQDRKGDLNLSSAEGLNKGGDQGPSISRTQPAESLLLQRVVAGEMPPESRGISQSLPDDEIAVLEAWIGAGATWPADRILDAYEKTSHLRAGRDWWSFRPIHRPLVPRIDSPSVANPIDAFIEQKLAENQMEMAPLADKQTLVRRAYVDLWGLRPTPDQIDEFVADDRPDAWERLIEQLLASPHYGERWGRYWLDVVRFAETCGYERDQLKPGIWKYRDWVISALNRDMPYDKFVVHQLAGDEIPDRSEASVIATGMLRGGTWNDEPNDPADYLYERLEDLVHTTSSAFLGLTVKCARCHDHKFDPIPQTDYYRLASLFWAGYIGQENLGGPNAEQLGMDAFGWTDKSAHPEPFNLLHGGDRRRPGPIVEPGFVSVVTDLDRTLSPAPNDSRTTTRRLQYAAWITDPGNPLTARVIVNRLWLHHFGEGIVRSPNNFGFKGELPSHPELLDWLAAELVSPTTPSNESDSAPLAWTLKRIHKLLMMTSTYRQSSVHPNQAEYSRRDAQNRWLWRAHRRRLDAESLRDSMLLASGQLNSMMGGPSFSPRMSREALEGLSRKDEAWQESNLPERNRRSIYMMTKRSRILPLMTTFDFCDTTQPCAQRDVTTVPTQALALLNNEFVHDQSGWLARRVLDCTRYEVDAQINQAWRLTLGRSPDADELHWARQHLQEQQRHFEQRLGQVVAEQSQDSSPLAPTTFALASLCHVLLNTNEFVYID